jgi:CHAT domain-containing protein/tetratricopeptide (TPR) repeat protein
VTHSPAWLPLVIVATSRLFAQTGADRPEPAVASMLLEPDRTLERQLAGGQSHEYRFTLQAGQYARVRAEQRSINVAVACFGPDGKELLAADAYQIGDSEDVELIGDTSGIYRLRLTASEAHAPVGAYEITLRDIGAATERHKARVAAARALARGMDSYRQGTREAMLQAIDHLSDALTNWRAAGDRAEVAKTLDTIGSTYIEIGDQKEALEYTTQALTAAQAANDRRAEARALNSMGEVHNYFGDKRKAAGYYEQALPLMRSAGDRAGEGNALNNLAVAYAHTGEKAKALALFAQAEQIFHELQDRRMIAEVSGNLGVTYDNLGEYQKALESHENDLALKRELGDRASQAVCLNNIGTAYSGLGAYQKALDAYLAALEINRSLDNRRSVAINLNNVAWVYDKLADRRRALTNYQESLDIVRRVNDRRTIAVTLNNIAEIHADLGNYQKALEVHTEVLQLRRAVGDADGEANTLNHLGTALAKLGERDKARDHFERALAIHRRSANPYMLARTLTNLGALDREIGNNVQALAHVNEALEVSRTIHDRGGQAAALAELARVERGRGNFATAHQRAEETLAALETERLAVTSPALRASFFASARDIQELDIDVLMHLHRERPEEGFGAAALSASERARARSLLELLGEPAAEIRRGVDAALLKRERELEHLISGKAEQQRRLLSGKHTRADAAAAEKELDTLTAGLEQVQSRIRETSPQYAALTQPATLNLMEIQTKVVDEGTVLLEYALGAEKSFVFAVTPSSMEVFELPPRAEIESAARRVYDLLTARNRNPPKETPAARANRVRQSDEAYFPAAAKAGRMLLGPVASKIENKRLLVVGEGVLQYLPFAALPEPGTGEQKKAPPLIANHEIITAPSASVMAVLRRETAGRKPAERAVAILADPVFSADDVRIAQQKDKAGITAATSDTASNAEHRSRAGLGGQDFLRLRFSRNEADEIARLAPAGATLKALDFEASRDTVLNPDFGLYRMVHFATHSLLNNEHPELSGIVLSLFDRSGHPQNGFLRLFDIYNLRLGSDLVVLSACQTALGGEIKGEGLIGLTRGFLYAGAPRVVASLWEVDDRTTAELMKRFYTGMLGRGERAAAALREAQVAFWKTKGWDAPYYWAAFTLQGEWR